MLSVLRLGFIPLMIMCNAQPRLHLPVLISNDAGFVFVMALFAFSNGYLSVIPFAQAPKYVIFNRDEALQFDSTLFLCFFYAGV